MDNLVPLPYSRVSVQRVSFALDGAAITNFLCGKEAYIHRHIYGDDCPSIELCPKKLFANDGSPALMRCCMVEKRFDLAGRVAVVPWGAELSLVEAALRALVGIAEMTRSA